MDRPEPVYRALSFAFAPSLASRKTASDANINRETAKHYSTSTFIDVEDRLLDWNLTASYSAEPRCRVEAVRNATGLLTFCSLTM
jgi:hypothetical protein